MLKKENIINVLCLHGCNQTKNIFEDITKHIRNISDKFSKTKECQIKFYYIEAQYDHSWGGKTWYKIELDITQIGKLEYKTEIASPTLEMLDNIIKELNINVLIGFSQGGNVVDTYLVNKSNNIKCAIIFSGYNFVDKNRNIDISTPVMNVFSEEDKIVPSKFMPVYKNMELKSHDKGHKLPTSKPFIREIIEFIYKNCITN